MTQLTWGRTGRLSGGEDMFLVGVKDIAISGSFSAPVVWTAGLPGNSGLAGFTVAADGTLTRFDEAAFPAWDRAGQKIGIEPLTLDGKNYLAVTGVANAGLWTYELAPDDTIPGRGTSIGNQPLPQDLGAVHSLTIVGETHVFGARKGQAQLESWRVTDDGMLGGQRAFAAGTTAGPTGLVAFDSIVQGSQQLLLVAGDGRDALLSYRLSADGTPQLADRVAVSDGLGILGPSALELVSLGGRSFAILAASGSSSLSVFEIAANGTLTAVDHVMDGLDTRFSGVAHLTAVELNGAVYVSAAGSDHGVTLFQLLPGGQLLHQASQEDTLELGLSDVSALAMRATGSDLQIAVTSETEQGLTWLVATPGEHGVVETGTAAAATLSGTDRDDMLLGGAGHERLMGGRSDDLLRDGAGRDTLVGGDGADVFVLDADGTLDRIEDFQANQDRIDLSNWSFFRSADQLEVRAIAGGLRLTFGNEVLDVLTKDGSALSTDTLKAKDLTDLDRILPGWFQMVQSETEEGLKPSEDSTPDDDGGTTGGEVKADTTTGTAAADTLTGGETNDILQGRAGADLLVAGAGDDTLDGGSGADTLNGGPGSDTYRIDNLEDVIIENRKWAGTDTAFASVDFWMKRAHIENLALMGSDDIRGVGNGLVNVITGNSGANILDGGKNNDTLIGGPGNDTFYLRAPRDTAIEAMDAGTDLIRAYRSVVMPENIERMYIQTDVSLNGIGNDQANLIVGNNADNILAGRGGRDTLKGQGGADTFVFDRAPGWNNVDRIIDFTPGQDNIWIKAALFGLESLERTPNWMFHEGSAAGAANDRILYDIETGAIRIDPDGTGPERAMVTFVLDGAVDLGHTDILLF